LRCASQGRFALTSAAPAAIARADATGGGQPALGAKAGSARTHPRERQIAELLRQGHSNKLIARALEVGLPTVKTHLINLFRKLG
jgi:DNA-binding NarL/FixJ family response regulator